MVPRTLTLIGLLSLTFLLWSFQSATAAQAGKAEVLQAIKQFAPLEGRLPVNPNIDRIVAFPRQGRFKAMLSTGNLNMDPLDDLLFVRGSRNQSVEITEAVFQNNRKYIGKARPGQAQANRSVAIEDHWLSLYRQAGTDRREVLSTEILLNNKELNVDIKTQKKSFHISRQDNLGDTTIRERASAGSKSRHVTEFQFTEGGIALHVDRGLTRSFSTKFSGASGDSVTKEVADGMKKGKKRKYKVDWDANGYNVSEVGPVKPARLKYRYNADDKTVTRFRNKDAHSDAAGKDSPIFTVPIEQTEEAVVRTHYNPAANGHNFSWEVNPGGEVKEFRGASTDVVQTISAKDIATVPSH